MNTEKELFEEQRRGFTHLTIPAEIWLRSDISLQAKCLWAELRSLHSKEVGGCFASEEYLCNFMQIKRRRLYEVLSELKDVGLVETVSFDGRHTIRKAIVPEVEYVNAQQECGKAHTSSAEKRTPSVRKSALSSLYIENKEENINTPPNPQRGKASIDAKASAFSSNSKNKKSSQKHDDLEADDPTKVKRAERVYTTDQEHQKLLSKYTPSEVQGAYEQLELEWMSKPKKDKSSFSAVERWAMNAYKERVYREQKLKLTSKPKEVNTISQKVEDKRRRVIKQLINANDNYAKIVDGGSGVIFSLLGSNTTYRLEYNDPNFDEDLSSIIKILKLKS